jgi:hypothetical protein
MAHQYYIDEAAETVFIEHSGKIGAEEIFEAFQEILADPYYRPGMNFLRDTRFRTVSAPRFQELWAQMGVCELGLGSWPRPELPAR